MTTKKMFIHTAGRSRASAASSASAAPGAPEAQACAHDFEVLIISGVEYLYCDRCRVVASLRAAVASLREEKAARRRAEDRLARALPTLATIAAHNTWDGDAARQCLVAIGRADLVGGWRTGS